MKMSRQIFAVLFAICMLLGSAVNSSSQVAGPPPGQGRDSGLSVSASYIHQFDTDLGSGGEFRLDRALFRADWKKKASEKVTLGMGANFDYSDYSFSHHMADPWNEIHAFNLSGSAMFDLERNWRLFVAPSVGVSAENGADWGNSLVAGGIVWTAYRFSPSFTLGLGAGVFSKPEEVSAFPVIIVDWKITERMRLANPLQAGPTGPAGLELSYALDGATVAAGGAYRSFRFRLDDQGPVPDGVGEDKSFPLWARLSVKIGETGTMSIFGGAMVGGNMLIEDNRGNELFDEDYDASPFLAASVSFRF